MRTYRSIPFQYELTEGTDFGEYKHVVQDFWGHNRWDITYANVFEDEAGEFWAYIFDVGATEYQGSGYEDPDEGTVVKLVKVQVKGFTFKPYES